MSFIPLTMTRGSDLDRTLTFDASLGDLTGWTFEVLDVVPSAMAGKISCTLTNGAARTARLFAEWGPEWPALGVKKQVTFYVRPSGVSASLPQFRVTLE